jgi:undecaprenyl-diphosphatase
VRRPPPLDECLLGLVQGPAELLPVSSSGHVEAARVLLRISGGDEVGLHAGSLAALVLGCRAEALEILRRLTWRRVGMHLWAGAIPAGAGYALELVRPRPPVGPPRRAQRPPSRGGKKVPGTFLPRRGVPPVAVGMVAGAGLLLVGERRSGTRSRWDAGPVDGVWLGLAQAAALWPGVSRNGSTLAAARLLGFAPEEANPLSREIGVPVTLGAVALRRAPLSPGTAAAFASAWLTLPVLRRLDRGARLWPWAAERAVVAALCWRASRTTSVV